MSSFDPAATAALPSVETVETTADGTTIRTSEFVRPDGGRSVVVERVDPNGVSTVESTDYPAPLSALPTNGFVPHHGGGYGAGHAPQPPLGTSYDPTQRGNDGAGPEIVYLPTANPASRNYQPQYATPQYGRAAHPDTMAGPLPPPAPSDQVQNHSVSPPDSSPEKGGAPSGAESAAPAEKTSFWSETRNIVLVGVVAVLVIVGAVVGVLFGTGVISTGSSAANVSSRDDVPGGPSSVTTTAPPPTIGSSTTPPVGDPPSAVDLSVGYVVIWSGVVPDLGGCEKPTPGVYASCGPGGTASLVSATNEDGEDDDGMCKEIAAQGAITCRHASASSGNGAAESSMMFFTCVGRTDEALAATVEIIEDGSVPCPVGASAGYLAYLAQDCVDEPQLVWDSMRCDPPDAAYNDEDGDPFCLVSGSCPLGEDCNLAIPALSARVPSSSVTFTCAKEVGF